MNQAEKKVRYLALFFVGIFPFLVNGYLNPLIAPFPILYWSFELLSWVALPCVIFYLLISKHGLTLAELGIVNPFSSVENGLMYLGISLLILVLMPLIYREAFHYFYNLAPSKAIFAYQSIIPESGAKRTIAIWYLAVSAGVVEELYFRGLLHKISELFGSPWILYIAFSPFIFSLIHWEGNLANMGATYVTGLIACLLYLRLRNIWPIIIGHIYTDLLSFQ